MSVILANAMTGQWLSHAYMSELPVIGDKLPDIIAQEKFATILTIIQASLAGVAVLSSILNMLTSTKKKPAISCLLSYVPFLLFLFEYYLMFTYTEWAWQ